jgi:formylglycine-generating enzyme required for sulfatase activity
LERADSHGPEDFAPTPIVVILNGSAISPPNPYLKRPMTDALSHKLRDTFAILLIFTACCVTLTPQSRAKEPTAGTPGIAAEKPAEGPSVQVAEGYMVPYKATIPGTDVEFEMVPVPGGEFLIGSPSGEAERSDDEGPQVRIRVEPFWIGKNEVTWGEYKSFMAMYDAFKKLQRLSANAGGNSGDDWKLVQSHAWSGDPATDWGVDAVTSATPLYDPSFTYGAGDDANQPAVTMTQFAARQYTKWLSGIMGQGYRLPSEAEWEYAARAGTTTAYSFGDDPGELDRYAWTEANADYQTHPVGTKKPNPWGLYDMHGNVAEWTLDGYQADGYRTLGAGPVDAKNALSWPTKSFPRVIRGGNWLQEASASRSAARHKSEEKQWKLSDPNIPLSPWWYTEEPATGVGMRIVRPLAALSADDKKRAWEPDVDDLRHDVRDRLREGRGALGIADKRLPAAVEAAEKIDSAEQ